MKGILLYFLNHCLLTYEDTNMGNFIGCLLNATIQITFNQFIVNFRAVVIVTPSFSSISHFEAL